MIENKPGDNLQKEQQEHREEDCERTLKSAKQRVWPPCFRQFGDEYRVIELKETGLYTDSESPA